MFQRIAVAVCIAAAPVVAFAQNDVAIWANSTQLGSTPFNRGNMVYNRRAGYGLSVSHFIAPATSLEFGWQQIRGTGDLHWPVVTATLLPSDDFIAMRASAFRAN